jgi:uncharacterized damage-inducible protein DinB
MITFMQSFLKELEHESIGTRKMLALVKAEDMDFKPHEKSMKMKDLAIHIADLPTWITMAINSNELDFATSPYNPKECNSGEELVDYFNKSVEEASQLLASASDDILEDTWTLRNGEIVYMQMPKLDTIRHSFSQMVHHRAQLGIYLRLLNIPIPGVYGPSAEEQGM